MKSIVYWFAVLSIPSLVCADSMTGTILHSPQTALFKLERPGTWSAGFTYEREHRKIRITNVRKIEAQRLRVTLDHAPVPWLALSAGVGTAIAEIDGREGEYGLDLRFGARIGVLEHVLEHSPVRGRTQLIRLDATGDYLWAGSNFSNADFNWQEWRFIPSVTYLQKLEKAYISHVLYPESTALHAGMVFSWMDGRYGGRSLSEHRNFGLRLGADARLLTEWTVYADVITYHASETSLTAGLKRQF